MTDQPRPFVSRHPDCRCGKCLDCLGPELFVSITRRVEADVEAERWPEDLKPRRVT